MPASFLHGVETIELNHGPRPITVVRSSVIGFLGVSMTGPRQALTIVQNATDAAQFGSTNDRNGTIGMATEIIQRQGAGMMIVVNVFDPAKHLSADQTETFTYTAGMTTKQMVNLPYVSDTSFVLKNLTVPATLIRNTDYSISAEGVITFLTFTKVNASDNMEITFKNVDFSLVVAADLVGTISGATKTGSKLFDNCYQMYGFNPKIWISPTPGSGYPQPKTTADLLQSLANKFRGHYLVDGSSVSPSAAVASRGTVGSSFDTSSKRSILLFPYLVFNTRTRPYSPFMAGIMARVDQQEGYWVSPSNKEIYGASGSVPTISAAINDPNTEANLLNSVGIVTTFNSFGTGLRTWGNRSGAYPTNTLPENFICVQRVADVIHESVELAMLPFVDRPINNALIDSIRDSVNGFLNILIGRGAIIDGVCTFDPAKNPPTVIVAGQLVFDITFMPPTPAERITFESYIDPELLSSLIGTNA